MSLQHNISNQMAKQTDHMLFEQQIQIELRVDLTKVLLK